MTIEAIIFDMDGLLVNSEPYWEQARQILASELDKPWGLEDQIAVMGSNTARWADYMIQRMGLEMTPQEVQTRILAYMQALYRERVPYLPGAIQAVELAASRYPTGLASGSHISLIEAVLSDPPMGGKFQAVVCADDMPHGKPAPDVYLEAARRLGVPPTNCVCLENSKNGMLAGLAAGMKLIAVPDERFAADAQVLARADLVLKSLEQFRLEDLIGL